jgi:hypothetical protein
MWPHTNHRTCPRYLEDITGIRVRGDALRENGRVIDLTLAQRWSGHPPQTILGDPRSGAVFQCGGANTGLAARQAQPSR